MSLPSLLFAGVPGGIELLVVLFIVFLLFGVPLTLLVVLGYKHLKNATDLEEAERLDELESEVAALRDQLDDTRGADGRTDADAGTPTEEEVSR